jgi:hypothetical protein
MVDEDDPQTLRYRRVKNPGLVETPETLLDELLNELVFTVL